MAITKKAPNTIFLSGNKIEEGQLAAKEALTPGHLVEMVDVSGENQWQKHATAANVQVPAVALNQEEMNKGIDDAWPAGSLCRVAFLQPGSTFYGLIASGQDISNAELLQSAGDGTLKAATAATADAGVAKFQSLDNPGAVTELTRIRVQVL